MRGPRWRGRLGLDNHNTKDMDYYHFFYHSYMYEPQYMKTSLNDEAVKIKLIAHT